MTNTPATADQVAELYGVGRTTVYRWAEQGMFDNGVIVRMPSPSRERDRLLFDRVATAAQFQKEMLESPVMLSERDRDARTKKMKEFTDG